MPALSLLYPAAIALDKPACSSYLVVETLFMARQTGNLKITGTLDGICFYKTGGAYYARTQSSLTGKRVKQDAAFAGSRQSAKRFAEGNRIASLLYKALAPGQQAYSLFCFLKSKAIRLLKEGHSSSKTKKLLTGYLHDFGVAQSTKGKSLIETNTSRPVKKSARPAVQKR